jgi:hypothetical protein
VTRQFSLTLLNSAEQSPEDANATEIPLCVPLNGPDRRDLPVQIGGYLRAQLLFQLDPSRLPD